MERIGRSAWLAPFIATGQDVANIAELHAAISYSQLLDNGDYYWSITLPSLIVATYGGGTGLPTQKQCLEMLGCYGAGKVNKLAEICAAVVLAREISLGCAVLHGDWVSGAWTAWPESQLGGARVRSARPCLARRDRRATSPQIPARPGNFDAGQTPLRRISRHKFPMIIQSASGDVLQYSREWR